MPVFNCYMEEIMGISPPYVKKKEDTHYISFAGIKECKESEERNENIRMGRKQKAKKS